MEVLAHVAKERDILLPLVTASMHMASLAKVASGVMITSCSVYVSLATWWLLDRAQSKSLELQQVKELDKTIFVPCCSFIV